MELLQGAESKKQHQVVKEFLKSYGFQILPLSENIGYRALVYIEEYALSSGLLAGDAIIAATAVENGMVLATGNRKHFKPIKDLSLKVFRPWITGAASVGYFRWKKGDRPAFGATRKMEERIEDMMNRERKGGAAFAVRRFSLLPSEAVSLLPSVFEGVWKMEKEHVEILLEDIKEKFELVLEGHQSLRHDIKDLRQDMNEKFDFLDAKIESVNSRLSAKIDGVAADLAAHRADTESHGKGYKVSDGKW
jgi:hypothetical protein